ncbi:MAG TPA: phosphoglycerol transferase I [Stenotrophomonas sp.]|jgi:phosphoglycerol transferase
MQGIVFALSLLLLLGLLAASPRRKWWKASLLSALLLSCSVWWLINQLSGDGVNAATLYHLRADTEGAGVADFAVPIALFAGLALASLLPLLLAVRPIRRLHLRGPYQGAFATFLIVFAVASFSSPLYADGKRLWREVRPVDYAQVVPEYETPVRPLHRRRNVVWIYAESLERTYLDERTFPGLTPNLHRLAAQGLDFRGIASPEGTGWTIAGLVASQCGVPLTTAPGDENSMDRMALFLPEAQCLGDYLRLQGYANHFIGGANAGFAGKGRFLASHGYDEVRDLGYFRARGVGPEHFSAWGVHDDVMLDDAWDAFQTLSEAGQPFLLSTLTMDTHHPAGHLPLRCQGQHYDSALGRIGMLDAIQCSDRLIGQFVDRIRNSRFADDTLIVIASDHLAMPNDLSRILARESRENLLLFLGNDIAPRQVAARAGSTLDSGATLLQLMQPNARTLGFGRSLLAPGTATSASAAAARQDGGHDYRRYLAFARSLWTGRSTRVLRVDDGQLLVGVQPIQPPVLLEYDKRWNLKAMYLENTSKQFDRASSKNTLAYVDRCTAFEDGSADGDWCALLVDRSSGMRLYRDAQLKRGVAIDAPMPPGAMGPRPRVRQPIMMTRDPQRTESGQYVIQMYASRLPRRAFWIEAVSSQRKVVLAQQWVQPDPDGRIRLPLGLDHEVDDLEIRAWLDYTEAERFTPDDLALVVEPAPPSS